MNLIRRALSEEEVQRTHHGLETYNLAHNAPPYDRQEFGVVAEENGMMAGAAYGYTVWDWMHVEVLYVEAEHRGFGIGTALINDLEAMARAQNLVGIHINTVDWQAPNFYARLGYTKYAAFEDFPRGHKRSLFRKYL